MKTTYALSEVNIDTGHRTIVERETAKRRAIAKARTPSVRCFREVSVDDGMVTPHFIFQSVCNP